MAVAHEDTIKGFIPLHPDKAQRLVSEAPGVNKTKGIRHHWPSCPKEQRTTIGREPTHIKMRKVVADAVERARAHQNPDGSFNIPWWGRGRRCGDDSEIIHMHGHMLSWLAIACREEDAPWIDNAAVLLAKTILRAAPKQEVSYSWLAHATEGINLHLQNKARRRGDMQHGQ